MARSKKYTPSPFMLPTSHYDKARADHAVNFIQSLKHTKGVWAGQPFILFDWQEKIVRDIFGTIKANGYRQFNTAFVEICKKAGQIRAGCRHCTVYARWRRRGRRRNLWLCQ